MHVPAASDVVPIAPALPHIGHVAGKSACDESRLWLVVSRLVFRVKASAWKPSRKNLS